MTKPQRLHCACPTENSGPTLGCGVCGSSMWSVWTQVFSTSTNKNTHTHGSRDPARSSHGWPLTPCQPPLSSHSKGEHSSGQDRPAPHLLPGQLLWARAPGDQEGNSHQSCWLPTLLTVWARVDLNWFAYSLTKYQLCPCRSANHGKLELCR